MKSIMKYLLSFVLLLSIILGLMPNNVSARSYGVTDTRTFILDKGNDLGAIIPKGYYYIPRIPFTEYKKIQQRFLDKLTYPGDFYSKRNITPDLVKGKSKYFVIQWNHPFYVKSLSGIKRVLSGYLFAYRKNGSIFWMDAKNFTPAFLTGYKSKDAQSIVIYPIRDRRNGEIKAFVQYPCGNLVCKDTLCTNLRVTPTCGDGVVNPEIGEQCDYKDPRTKDGCTQTCNYKALSCNVLNTKQEILNVEHPNVKVKVSDPKIKIKKVYVNRNVYTNARTLNNSYLQPGIYKLNAVAINPYTGKEFLCDSSTFRVKAKEFCGDGIVNGNEECDYKDPNNNGACNTTCKFIGESCSVITKRSILEEPTKFLNVVGLRRSKTTKITDVSINSKTINPGSFVFDTNGTYNIKVEIENPYSHKTAICENTIKYKKKEFCGDGIKNGYEQCDDGNKVNGDGCSTNCILEQPFCGIKTNGYTFNEGEPYYKFVKLNYKGNFDSGNTNQTQFFDNYRELLSSKIHSKNECSDLGTLEYTVSNPLDKSITRTCSVKYRVHKKEYCGDGIVNSNEQCDPEDHYTGPYCNSTCQFKRPEKCDVISNTFKEGKRGSLVIDTDYFAEISKVKIGTKTIQGNGNMVVLNGLPAGNFKTYVLLKNKLDMKNTRTKVCELNILVEKDVCKN